MRRFTKIFPEITLQQTYGLSEVGILQSKSKSSDSLWVRIGGEGFLTRVVDGVLQIKAKSAILGYLNAPSKFTEDGWFDTGDAVEVDGEYFKILGRKSEIINVGGEEIVSIRELVLMIGEATGKEPILTDSCDTASNSWVCDSAKRIRLLGRQKVSLRDGIRKTIEASDCAS